MINTTTLNLNFYGKHININLDKATLNLDSQLFDLTPVLSEKIINAYHDGKVYLEVSEGETDRYLNNPLYYCSRNIFNRDLKNEQKLYMDFLVYDNNPDVLPNHTVNRSLGHNNDVLEYEVHQVLNGIIFSVFYLENNYYFGVFQKGDFFEIPAGAFHCSYILEGPSVVANYYCNTYWGSDISKKPYFQNNNNNITMQKISDNEFFIKSNDCNISQKFCLDQVSDFNIAGMKPYEELYHEGLLKIKYKDIADSIFDLFHLVDSHI